MLKPSTLAVARGAAIPIRNPQSALRISPVPLTATEKRCLQLFDAGKSIKQIATEMGISENTVRTHSRNILVKTMCACLREAAFKIGGARIQ